MLRCSSFSTFILYCACKSSSSSRVSCEYSSGFLPRSSFITLSRFSIPAFISSVLNFSENASFFSLHSSPATASITSSRFCSRSSSSFAFSIRTRISRKSNASLKESAKSQAMYIVRRIVATLKMSAAIPSTSFSIGLCIT